MSPKIPYQDRSSLTFGIVLNIQKGVFTDHKVRKAISLSVDRQGILDAYGKSGVIATGAIPQGFLGYKAKKYQLNLPLAKSIISKKVPVNKQKIIAGFVQRHKRSDAIEKSLIASMTSIGLNLVIKYEANFSTLLKGFRENKYDLIIKGDGPKFYEPSTIFTPYITGQFENISNYSNKELDRLYYAYEGTTELTKKVDILQKMESIIREEIPMVPLLHPTFRTWRQPSIHIGNKSNFAIRYWEFPYHQYKEIKLLTNFNKGGS